MTRIYQNLIKEILTSANFCDNLTCKCDFTFIFDFKSSSIYQQYKNENYSSKFILTCYLTFSTFSFTAITMGTYSATIFSATLNFTGHCCTLIASRFDFRTIDRPTMSPSNSAYTSLIFIRKI